MQIFCISWSLQQGLYPMTWHILGHRAGQGRAGLSQDRAQSGLVIYVRSAICPTSPTFQNITNKKLIKEFVRVSKDQLRRWVFVRWVNLVCSKIQSPNSNIFFKPSSSAKDVKNKREKEVVFVWIIIHRQGSSWWETREQMTEREMEWVTHRLCECNPLTWARGWPGWTPTMSCRPDIKWMSWVASFGGWNFVYDHVTGCEIKGQSVCVSSTKLREWVYISARVTEVKSEVKGLYRVSRRSPFSRRLPLFQFGCTPH